MSFYLWLYLDCLTVWRIGEIGPEYWRLLNKPTGRIIAWNEFGR